MSALPAAWAQFTGGPPVITREPQSQIAAAGTDATFRVTTAPSFTPLRYQWVKDGVFLPGATNPIVVISNAQLAHAGSYGVIIANAAGAIQSEYANLAVVQPSVTPTSVSLGANVTLRVISTRAQSIFQWQFGGANIAGATNSILILTNAQLANAGVYSVRVTVDEKSVVLPLTVSVDPAFTKITTGAIVSSAVAHGVAWGDYNNDGFVDLLIVRNGADSKNQLFRNNGDGSFTAVAAAEAGSILTETGASLFGSWGDYDNDGNLDAVVTRFSNFGSTSLHRNNGNGTFNRITTNAVSRTIDGAGASWADYDNDGWLDLLFSTATVSAPKLLFHNNGDGSFTRLSLPGVLPGLSSELDVLAGAWGDFDNDGFLDLFLPNSLGSSLLYHNNGDGTFTKVTNNPVLETASGSRTQGTWADFNNDGFLDLCVGNLSPNQDLFRNNGDGTFTKLTNAIGGGRFPPASLCAWGDYDNDGWIDLFLGTRGTNNFLYRNNGDETFTKVSTGSLVNDVGSAAFGFAWADYDNNGFLDLVVGNQSSPGNFLYRNNGNNNNWLLLKLVGTASNRAAIGAKVRVRTRISGQDRWQLREISGGGVSQNDLRPHFGLGNATNIDTVRIEWPSGIVQELRNVAPRQFLNVTEPVLVIGPKNVEFVGGAEVTFTVLTNATGSTNFQWQLNGVDLPDATGAVLSVSSVGASSAGKYTVRVMLPSGDTVTSTAGVIQPPVPPSITQQPASLLVDVGAEATFTVAATGSMPLTYQWRLNDAPITDATNATLIVSNVGPEHAGDYTVVVTNPGGSITSTNATLALVGAPRISGLSDQSVSLGANVTFVALAGGTVPLSYQWRLNGVDLAGETNRTLVLTNASLEDSGRFSVRVTNPRGSALSREATLTIDPTFTKITAGPVVEDKGNFRGGSWGDYDADGDLDLFVARRDGANLTYRNNGDRTFSRITGTPLTVINTDSLSGAWGDFDNDGHLDLFVANHGHNRGVQSDLLYRNLGAGSFSRLTTLAVVVDAWYSVGAGWADYDNDGHLDLFVSSDGNASGANNLLYRNNGDGTFAKVIAGRIVNDGGVSVGFGWADYDNDGYIDLAIANGNAVRDEPTFLYRNNGEGTFTRIVSGPVAQDLTSSRGCAWGDYDNDGDFDLFVSNRGRGRPGFLYRNNGEGSFTRVDQSPLTTDTGESMSVSWADYDNDGHLDLFVLRDAAANLFYRNNGEGNFTSLALGSLTTDRGSFSAAAWADYDNDGFLDVFVSQGLGDNVPATKTNFLYRNNGNSNAWIIVQCAGRISNRTGIGAKVRLRAVVRGAELLQVRQITGGDGFQNSQALYAHFGLGDAPIIDTLRIEWPSGIVQEMRNLAVKQFLTVTEPDVTIAPRLQELAAGSDMTFTVSNNLSAPVTYQWRFNGADLPGETNATLIVRNAQTSNLGKYTVALVNPASAELVISAPARLRLPGFPEITVQPQGQDVDVGAQVIFQVTATGAEPLFYQWRLYEEDVPGATNKTLTLTNVQAIHAGHYTVVVTNLVGSVTSAAATLNLLGAATISVHPRSQSVSPGARVVLTVTAFGTPPLAYQWRSNGVDIAGATGSVLILTNVTPAVAAVYAAVVTNAQGSISSRAANLTVDPTFTKITTGRIVTDGGSASGAVWGDYDNDGFLDLFVASWGGSNRDFLYRNNRDGTFTSMVSTNVGRIVTDGGNSMTAMWGDYDNDGFADLFVLNYNDRPFLFRNTGDGKFSRVTNTVFASGSNLSGTWGDFDNDGLLDIFVGTTASGTGSPSENDIFYRNTGTAFQRMTTNEVGRIVAEGKQTWGVAAGDYDNDGDLDLFAAFVGGTALYRNNGRGFFEITTTNDVGAIITQSGFYGGGSWGDYDNDGFLDLFVPAYNEKSLLLKNNNGRFIKITDGQVANDVGYSYAAGWGDYDNDGHLDLFVATAQDTPATDQVNFLYRNNGDGTFEKITTGSLVNDLGRNRGVAWADYDNDGFLDLFVPNVSGPNFLYRNNGNFNHWLKIRCVGTASNRAGIGAKVRVRARIQDADVWQVRQISGADGFSGGSELIAHFGLGNAAVVDTLRIEWPSGSVQELRNVPVEQFLTVTEPAGIRFAAAGRLPGGPFQFTLTGPAGERYVIQGSVDLLNWRPLVTVTNATGMVQLSDPESTNFNQRFYRAVRQ